MESTVAALIAPGKGILAADESFPTIEKRFKALNISSTEENRRAYREMLFATPGLSEFISGVILFDETIRQKAADGTPLVEVLKRQGIIPGITVDKGAKPLAGFPGEKITEGLDGLRERLAEYRQLGAQFTKWRAVITIGVNSPNAIAHRVVFDGDIVLTASTSELQEFVLKHADDEDFFGGAMELTRQAPGERETTSARIHRR